jgi:hypothetical protein
VAIAITLVFMCVLGTALLAQVSSQKKARNPSGDRQTGEAKNASAEVSIMNLTSGFPTKEYIYAGSKLVATEEAISFADVTPGTPFYSDILKIGRKRVTIGCGVNAQGQPLFCPNDSVTREQMAAFIIRALGDFFPSTPPSQRFTDVPPSNQFYAFIDEMAVRQITIGCGAGIYCPTAYVPHEQMAAFIIRGLGQFTPPTPPTQRFSDVPPSNIFYNFIDRMAVMNIWQACNGVPGPNYCPSALVKRSDMAHILVQAFGATWQ